MKLRSSVGGMAARLPPVSVLDRVARAREELAARNKDSAQNGAKENSGESRVFKTIIQERHKSSVWF